VALCYFAGGSPYDISLVHGIGYTDDVFCCVWTVVDAVDACPSLGCGYPADHDEHQKITDGFLKSISRGTFDCWAGAIDGIIISIKIPSEGHCQISECGSNKFFCGRKKKFSLNMQATCDHNKKFLDIYLKHPASTSDYLSFLSSPLFCKLETARFMKPGLYIFGDNAYVNTQYMATPYKAMKQDSKDGCNFFHSNCRITIECCFGMLVHRWGILCKPMSAKLPIVKVTAMIRCLCQRLERNRNAPCESPKEQQDEEVANHIDSDGVNIAHAGGSTLVDGGDNGFSPEDLLHGADHFDDVSRAVRVSRKNMAIFCHASLCVRLSAQRFLHSSAVSSPGMSSKQSGIVQRLKQFEIFGYQKRNIICYLDRIFSQPRLEPLLGPVVARGNWIVSAADAAALDLINHVLLSRDYLLSELHGDKWFKECISKVSIVNTLQTNAHCHQLS
jgi:DDE superfamily endonuclease